MRNYLASKPRWLSSYLLFGIGFVSILFFFGCNSSPKPVPQNSIPFHNRQIDLEPYLNILSFPQLCATYATQELFYVSEGENSNVYAAVLNPEIDLNESELISDLDFSKRNIKEMRYNQTDQKLYWLGDEANEESFNVYCLNIEDGEWEKLTNFPQVMGWNWDNTRKQLAYTARLGKRNSPLGQLRLLDLENGTDQIWLEDIQERRFSNGDPIWRPNGTGLIVQVEEALGSNLLLASTRSAKPKRLFSTPLSAKLNPQDIWLDNDTFLYTSDEGGVLNLYQYSLDENLSTRLTNFRQDISNVRLLTVNERPLLFAACNGPLESKIFLIDPQDHTIVHEKAIPFELEILDAKSDRLIVFLEGPGHPFQLAEISVKNTDLSFSLILEMPDRDLGKVVHAEVEAISYPTFDIDPATGKQRLIQAYLYKPKYPLEKKMAVVQSFGGGSKDYNKDIQILAQAGIYVLSPSPRGSNGFGTSFSALDDGDLGGNETLDIIYGARYFSRLLNISPSRVGCFGTARGGYTSMRLLTFPGKVNEHIADFDWGFGISHSGFYDINELLLHANPPDWIHTKIFSKQPGELRSRSPLYFTRNLKGKVLLTHGTRNSKIPISGMRQWADSLEKWQKPFSLIEFEGQGQNIRGFQNQVRSYRTLLGFLEGI